MVEGFAGQFKAFQTIGNKLSSHGTVNIAAISDINAECSRKIAECAFRSGLKLVLIKTSAKGSTETIIVKATQDGRTFADLVKGVKDGVDPNNIDVTIKNMKRAKDGSVVIVTNGNTERLRREIEEKVGGIRTSVGGRKILEILDLDPTVTKDELIGEIKKVASADERRTLHWTVSGPPTAGFK